MDLISDDVANDMLASCREVVCRGNNFQHCGRPSRFLVVNPADASGLRVCGQHVAVAVKVASRGGDVIVRSDDPGPYA